MSTLSTPTPPERLRVSAYDRVSSMLVSLLAITGLTVSALLFLYFAKQLSTFQIAVPVKPVELPGGGGGGQGDGSLGAGGDLDLSADIDALPDPAIEDTLTTIAEAVEAQAPLLFDEQMDAPLAPPNAEQTVDVRRAGRGGAGGGIGTGFGTGTGSGRGPGSGGGFGGGRGTREPDREIVFEPENLYEYAQFLDFFHIELGVLGQDNQIHYAYNLSEEVPGVRVGAPADDLRLYMNSARGRFAALDLRLASRAGIAGLGRIILQFYPDEAAAILYRLEAEHAEAAGRKREDIRRTIFRVIRNGERFDFRVEQQFYR